MSGQLKKRALGRTGIMVSELGLGTAELGYVYGVGPRTLPTDQEATALLCRSVELGVTFFDTARFYGEAERRIYESGIVRIPQVVIATKCGHALDADAHISDDDLERALAAEVEMSLQTLGIESIALVQVHGGTAERIRDGSIIRAMQKLKSAGKVVHVGISVRGEEAALAAIESGFFETLQLAHSILDQRMAVRVFVKAQKHGVGIINRSVFLKGALTSAVAHLPSHLTLLKQHSAEAASVAAEAGIDLPALALRFALSQDGISTVLVGTNKIQNIERAVEAALQGPLPNDLLERLRSLAIHDQTQIDPKYWPTEAVSDRPQTTYS